MGRVLLALAFVLALVPSAMADPPVLLTGQSPEHGKLIVDPILYYVVAYSEPGTTDCYTAKFGSCIVEGPGQNVQWVRVEIEGAASGSFFLDNMVTNRTLVVGSCAATNPAHTECIFPLPVQQSSDDFRLQVVGTKGEAGSSVAIYLEEGDNFNGIRL